MKYIWKQKAVCMLAVLLVLGLMLTACGGGSKAAGGAEEEKSAAGTYVGNFDMTELLNQETEAAGIQFSSSVTTDFILKLNEDETFVFDIDADSLVSSVTEAVQNEIDSIIAGLMGEEVTADSAEEIAKAAGYDSYDAFKEEILKQITESLDEDALSELTDSCHIEGTYTLKDKDLNLSAEGEDSENFSVKVGTIQDDGSILLDLDANDQNIQITFVKQ